MQVYVTSFLSSCPQGFQSSLQVIGLLEGTNNQFSSISYDWNCHLEKTGRTNSTTKQTSIISSAGCQHPPKYNSPEPDLPVVPDSALLTENSLLLSPPAALRVSNPAWYQAWQNREEWFQVLNHSQSTAYLHPAQSTLGHRHFCYLKSLFPDGQMGGHESVVLNLWA